MKQRQTTLLGLLLAVAMAACSGSPPQTLPGDGISSRDATVERQTIRVWISGTGTLEAAATSSLAFSSNGNVGEIGVQIGDRVQEGSILIALDPDSLDASLASAEADLISAQNALETLVDESNWQAQLAQAQAELAQARDALKDAEYIQRVRQEGNRASRETIDAAEARLVLARDNYDRAKAAYDRLSGRASDDPSRAVALTNLEAARQSRDSALRTLNWYTGHPTDIEQALLQADVAVAQATLSQAEERVATLENGPDPDEVAAAEARVRAAQARVNQSRLTAPFDGTVLSINYDIGDQVTPGAAAVVLGDLSALHVDTSVDELDIAQVELGLPVEVTLDALPDLILSGEVGKIDLVPLAGSTATEYAVRVSLTSSDPAARIGMTSAVNILVAEKEQALVVPNWALRFDSGTGEVYVQVKTADGSERQSITLGLRNDEESEVVDGLRAGDVVTATSSPEEPSVPSFFGG